MMRHLYLNCVHATSLQQWYLCICIRFSFWLKVKKVCIYFILLVFSLYKWFVVEGASTSCYQLQSDFPQNGGHQQALKKVHQPGSNWGHSLPKTIISPENWWLEDELSYWNGPFFNGHVCFWGVYTFDSSRKEGCQQGCSGRNSAAPERTDRLATAFAEDTGPWEGGTWKGPGEGGYWVGQLVGVLGVVGLLFDLGFVDLCRGKCFVKVREVGFGGLLWIWNRIWIGFGLVFTILPFFCAVFCFCVFCMDISLTHVFLGYHT